MSYIEFQTYSHRALVDGRERHRLDGHLINRFVDNLPEDLKLQLVPNLLFQTIELNHTLLQAAVRTLQTEVNGQRVQLIDAALNFNLNTGDDSWKLAARIDGQCEAYAFVEGPNRAWLAEKIKTARTKGVLADGMGWEGVVDLLERSKRGPVVSSYSGMGGFPPSRLVTEQQIWQPQDKEQADEEWEELNEWTQWRLGIRALRRFNQTGLIELAPESWDSFYFLGGEINIPNPFPSAA